MKRVLSLIFALSIAGAADVGTVHPPMPGEKHLANIRQLTAVPGAENAEAYLSFDEKKLIFQSTRLPFDCDQMFTMNLDGSDLRLVSTGRGRTTCGYFLAGDRRILYASTHEGAAACPPKPDLSRGYVWAPFKDYDIHPFPGGIVFETAHLRGMVDAGAEGNDDAVVCALDLAPTQLRIGGLIATTPGHRGKPEPELGDSRRGGSI